MHARRASRKANWVEGLIGGGLAVAAMASPAVAAGPNHKPPSDTYGVTGDWGGHRDRLKDDGWTFQIKQVFEGADLLSGGRHLATGAGETQLGAKLDTGKAFGFQGGSIQITVTDRYGSSLGPSAGVEPFMPYIEVHGRGDMWRLTQFFYAQDLPDGFNLKLGRVDPGSDFDAFSCEFQNLTFCAAPPGNIADDYWFNWPVSEWGGRLKWKGGTFYAEGGAYQVNPKNLTHGFNLDANGKGVLVPVEVGWTPKLGTRGLPGTWLIGGWWSDAPGPDLSAAANGASQPISRRHRYGVYAAIDQQLTGTPGGKGLTGFVNWTWADRRTTRLQQQFAVGLSYQGLIPGRDKDQLALAYGVTHLNSRAADAAALAGPAAPRLTDERAFELDYRFKPLRGLTLTPNLQWVDHPGGKQRHATVLGLKTTLRL